MSEKCLLLILYFWNLTPNRTLSHDLGEGLANEGDVRCYHYSRVISTLALRDLDC